MVLRGRLRGRVGRRRTFFRRGATIGGPSSHVRTSVCDTVPSASREHRCPTRIRLGLDLGQARAAVDPASGPAEASTPTAAPDRERRPGTSDDRRVRRARDPRGRHLARLSTARPEPRCARCPRRWPSGSAATWRWPGCCWTTILRRPGRTPQVARRLASRVAVVREASALTAYACGDFETALAELRAYRRLSGDQSHLPLMADCERGLGRPERALELAASPEAAALPEQVARELRIVVAGARSRPRSGRGCAAACSRPTLRSGAGAWATSLGAAPAVRLRRHAHQRRAATTRRPDGSPWWLPPTSSRSPTRPSDCAAGEDDWRAGGVDAGQSGSAADFSLPHSGLGSSVIDSPW